jgi:peptidoglycan/xylan/chitin deacetylase (PgdA/CDA1 family)
LRSFATVAAPILHELEIPASVFVCAGLVDGGGWIWTREMRERLRSLDAGQDGLGRELGAPANGMETIIAWMKSLSPEDRKRAEGAIRERTPDFRIADAAHLGHDLMSWDELRSLPPDHVIVGSHSMTHPMLPTLDAEDQRWEMAESRRVLEERVGRPVRHFAYPNGAADATTVAIAREIYVSAWGTETGFLAPGADSHRLRRVAMPHSLDGLSWTLHQP